MIHIIGDKKVFCPLCNKVFKKRIVAYQGHQAKAYFCPDCKIGTFDFDPAFDKWRDTDKEIPCAKCATPMNWFIRYFDGFFAAVCPKCKFGMRKDTNMSFTKDGQIDLEDFEQPEPEVIDLKIPLNKLNLTPDQKKKLRDKGRGGKNGL